MSAWEVLGVPKEVQRGLSEQSFTTPTPIQTLSLPPAIFHHRDIIGAAETVSWIRAVRFVEVSFFMCIVCLLFFLLFQIIFFCFFFFEGGERERVEKKSFFNMYMYLLWCTPCSFTRKKTFPYITANSFCYFRARLWPELMSKVGTCTKWELNNYKYDFCKLKHSWGELSSWNYVYSVPLERELWLTDQLKVKFC